MQSEEKKRDGGVQSVEVAGQILRAMADLQGSGTLMDIARRTGMHPSKVHRYLLSLSRAELVEQDVARGRYNAGPLALSLGLARLRDLDFVSMTAPELAALRDATNETALLAMWSDQGPVVLRLEESGRRVYMNVRVGSILPICRSATGEIFAAFLPLSQVQALIDRELATQESRDGFLAQLAAIRASKLASVQGALVPGVNALAAPVFNVEGQIAAVIGLVGRDVDLDVSVAGGPATALAQAARSISQKLGAASYGDESRMR